MSYSPPDLELAALVRHRVACGFEDAQTVYERVTEMYPDVDESIIDTLVDDVIAERDAAAASWPDRTDCFRLDAAFIGLEEVNVLARHNFACCQRCGVYEIGDEIAKAREAKKTVDGYVFYHQQDTDSAVTTGVLHLRYGGTAGTPDADIARRIVDELRARRLDPAWDGDPTKTIRLALDWKRKEPPIVLDATRTAEDCIAWWCDALPRATLSSAAARAGRDLPRALDAVGLADAALAWARAHFDDGDRAVACARLAAQRRSPELLLAAWKLAPWDRRGTFVQLLVEAGLDDARVFAIARDKVDEARRDSHGGAAAAWLFARRPDFEPAKERALEAWRQQSPLEDAVLALAAGLWRAGDAELRDPVVDKFQTSFHVWARRAAIAGAPTADDVLAIAPHVHLTGESELPLCICDRLLELDAHDAARTFAKQNGEACEAYLAWITHDRERISEIAARSDEHTLLYHEGILSADNLRDIRIAIAASTNDRALLARVAGDACAAARAEYRDEALAMLAGEPLPIEDTGADKLATAIGNWSAATSQRARIANRRAGRKILRAATAHARRGDLERARELFELARAPFTDEDGADFARCGMFDEIVEACVALGDLDLIESLVAAMYIGDSSLSIRAIGLYVPALVEADSRERAIALLDGALRRVETRRDLLDLIPAILAFANNTDDVRAAWKAADDVLAALAIT